MNKITCNRKNIVRTFIAAVTVLDQRIRAAARHARGQLMEQA